VRKGWAKNPAFLFAPLFLKANMFSTSSAGAKGLGQTTHLANARLCLL